MLVFASACLLMGGSSFLYAGRRSARADRLMASSNPLPRRSPLAPSSCHGEDFVRRLQSALSRARRGVAAVCSSIPAGQCVSRPEALAAGEVPRIPRLILEISAMCSLVRRARSSRGRQSDNQSNYCKFAKTAHRGHLNASDFPENDVSGPHRRL